MMTTFKEYLDEQLKKPDFKKEWEPTELEYTIVKAILDARKKSGLTQKELSEKTGIPQADISRMEKGNANPSIKTLRRLAKGMGMKLVLKFVPQKA